MSGTYHQQRVQPQRQQDHKKNGAEVTNAKGITAAFTYLNCSVGWPQLTLARDRGRLCSDGINQKSKHVAKPGDK